MAENKEKMEEFSTEEAVKEAMENAEAMAEEAEAGYPEDGRRTDRSPARL